jgi:hypothetical protein
MSSELPSQIITNSETKTVTITPEIEETLPGIDQAFAETDKAFLDDPEKYLLNLESSMFNFRSSEGSGVACSLLHGPGSKLDELLVICAAFSDRDMKSNGSEMYEYITASTKPGFFTKEKISPKSANQTTKSAVIFELLKALGKNIPVLTIYGPVPSHAYSFIERKQFRKGDFSPDARLIQEAVTEAQDRLHGPKSETQINDINLSGASLGASRVIGAGRGLLDKDFQVPTVTAQELILGPKNLPDLAKRFTVGQYVGESSDEILSQANPKIEESAFSQAILKYGSEPLGMTARMVKGMKPTYMLGLTKPEATTQAIEHLLDNNVDLLVALAENSALTYQTAGHIPHSGERVIQIRGENGQKIGHLADDHVALSALVAALNIARPRK